MGSGPAAASSATEATGPCRACGSGGLRIFLVAEGMPVDNATLAASRDQALAIARGDIRLGFCKACGLIQNTAFQPERVAYTEGYEGSQAFSPRFQSFARELATHLIERYGLRGAQILEIGSGDGSFLELLCELTSSRGVGFDPTYRGPAETGLVRFVSRFFGAADRDVPADLVCCRHTLEHVAQVRDFVGMVRAHLTGWPDALVLFEVPEVSRILREQAFWDIYYEHCSYFSSGSLGRLFQKAGFELLDLRLGFEGQYLVLEARPGTGGVAPPDDCAELAAQVDAFERHVAASLAVWRGRLQAAAAAGRRIAIWGGSSKTVGFLTMLGVGEPVGCVVDINPRKQGRFIPGTGHPVVAPEALVRYQPDLVVLMNPVYRAEVAGQLKDLGVAAELEAV